MKALGPLTLVLAIVVAILVGYQAVVLTQRLDAIAQRLDTATQQLGTLSDLGQRVDSAGQQIDAVGDRLDDVEQGVDDVGARMDDVGARVDAVGARVDAMATDVAAVARVFRDFPIGGFPTGSPPPAIQAGLGEAIDVDAGDDFSQLSGRYTVLSAERLTNDVEVVIRWEATVGPLSTGYGWSAYDDGRFQYEVDPYDEDDPGGGFPLFPVLAEGRIHEGSMYVRGAAGAEHLWLELMDISFSSPLVTVQLW